MYQQVCLCINTEHELWNIHQQPKILIHQTTGYFTALHQFALGDLVMVEDVHMPGSHCELYLKGGMHDHSVLVFSLISST